MKACISVYRELTALWKIKSQEYSNKIVKEKGFDALLEIYKKYNFENVTNDTVKKKISSMRASFRRKHKKLKTLKSGIGSEEVEEPSLWYYSLLLFTADHEEPRDTISNGGSDDNGETEVCK
ncbi:hypothetical protein JTB14_030314 [Gonioctena quinquepunctata]|nr:hypothetical protein JTB14_030314 [Gonioctena quinquepunctata]